MFGRYSPAGLILRAAPLYGGPLLAGWSQGSVVLYAALAAIFMAMQLMSGKMAQHGAIPPIPFLALLVAPVAQRHREGRQSCA